MRETFCLIQIHPNHAHHEVIENKRQITFLSLMFLLKCFQNLLP